MKKIFLISTLFMILSSLTVQAGDHITRKIGQKFFDAGKELNLTSETEVIVTVRMSSCGDLFILNTNSEDEKVNAYVKQRMESIVLKEKPQPGIYKYKLIFRPE